ncbi:MAG: conjugative transfer ATPase [Proteobacteria bacterium]|nr:conjugative transfer ATPase [Pseudomonadota bacterium]
MGRWSLNFRRRADETASDDQGSAATSSPTSPDLWDRYVTRLTENGIPLPGVRARRQTRPATDADETQQYEVSPSFLEYCPWVEYLPESKCILLEDGQSVAAFFELSPLGTEGREPPWLEQARDALENALQDSFDELEVHPWIVQIYAQDETGWDDYLRVLKEYVHPRARDSVFTRSYLRRFEHHLRAISKPGGLFHDRTVTHLPWRGQTRRVRMVLYRRATAAAPQRRTQSAIQALSLTCERIVGGLANAGIRARRLEGADIHDWLLRWFNPHPTWLGTSREAQERFYGLTAFPPKPDSGEFELASGTDFAERLFFAQPRNDVGSGVWYFDNEPHRVVAVDRLRAPPSIGHLTGERRTGGDAINTVFDSCPEGTVMCITLVITPQDLLEADFNRLDKKSVGGTVDSEQTRKDLQQVRSILGSAHKLYRASIAFYVRGNTLSQLEERASALANVLFNAGLQPVRDEDEVAPCNSYLRWLPCNFNPALDTRKVYTRLFFAQHVANLLPTWGRSRGTGHPGITLFSRGGEAVTIDPLNRLDRQMNAHLFLFGPTGSGKSAMLNNILNQITAIYRPRLFIVESGNSFGLFGEFAQRLGLTVHRVRLAPASGVSLAPFADAWRLVVTPSKVQTLEVEALDETAGAPAMEGDEQRDVLGELEITARLMITGGEDKEELRMTRADRSLIRQCILDAARECVACERTVLAQDVRDALRQRARDVTLADARRARLLEMADAMDIFCQGVNGEMFNRPGTPWPEADLTIVDLATFAREGYNAELSIAYISLINSVNNIAERDQFLGRPLINVTDEGHIILKNPLLAPYVVKITKMWRKLGAWFWLATQNLDDFPRAAEAMLNMIEWWFCLSMPPDEVEKIARFRELTPAQRSLLLSARKQSGDYAEGVILSRSMEVLVRIVSASLYLALAMTETEEKNERFELMQQQGLSELDAALEMANRIDRSRGIEPLPEGVDVS